LAQAGIKQAGHEIQNFAPMLNNWDLFQSLFMEELRYATGRYQLADQDMQHLNNPCCSASLLVAVDK
jgi:hypothetical protein